MSSPAPLSDAPEGRIDIRIRRRLSVVLGVELHSTRPQWAQRLMAGRTPADAAALAGRIYSLCGHAQGIAAAAAATAAAGRSVLPASGEALAEMAREHAWRLLLDWPQQAGLAADMATLLALRRAAAAPEELAAALDVILAERLLGRPAAAWLAQGWAEFEAWRQQGETMPARLFRQLAAGGESAAGAGPLLPPLSDWSAADLDALGRQALTQTDYCARPAWRGQAAETGAVSRQRQQPLLAAWIARHGRDAGAHLLARLLELAMLPGWLRGNGPVLVRARTLGENTGLAGVETSRGVLFHVVRLAAGKVADYRIIAPTEWNFHPAGAFVATIAQLPAEAGLEARVRQAALALDPCVAYGVEVIDA